MRTRSLTIGLFVVAALGLALLFARRGIAADGPRNPGFEDGAVGEVPKGWFANGHPSPSGYATRTTDRRPRSGRFCAVIETVGSLPEGGFGNLLQSVDATPYRGKHVRFRAAVRTEGVESSAQLWLRVDREGGKRGFFDNMHDRPIVAATWADHEIVGEVAEDAANLTFGVMLKAGTGRVFVDDVSLEIVIAAREAPPQAARPPSDRVHANRIAFARLYGYVRFFHPSDEAAAMDANAWNLFAIATIGSVEEASTPEELAAALVTAFRPVAPSLEVWAGGPDDGPPAPPRQKGAKGAVSWRHRGCGSLGSTNSIYKSLRVAAVSAPSAGRLLAGTSLVKDLSGGVSCRLPVAVDVDADGKTLPRATAGAASAPPARPSRAGSGGTDRATRLADVVIAWNVFQHFFPYFDVSKPDWPAVLHRSLASAATDADDAAFLLTLRRLVAELRDGHGSVFGSAAPGPMRPAFALDWADDGKGGDALAVVAVSPQTDTVKVGDEIVAVGGTPTAKWVADARSLVSAATEGWARHRIASDPPLLAPGKGKTFEFTVRRGGKEQEVRVPRFVRGMGVPPPGEKRPTNGAEVGPPGSGIVYFDLNRAENDALEAAMPQLLAAKGIVFDLRGYPGSAGSTLLRHLSDHAIESARWNVPIFSLPDQDPAGLTWDESRWNLPPALPRLGGGGQKIAFLTGGGAISYAESCLGIVEAYGLGEIVGGPTAGTNGNVNPFTLPGGFHVAWTGMKVLKHDGSRHHGVGIAPTVPVRRTIAGIAAGRDEILDAAVKKLGE